MSIANGKVTFSLWSMKDDRTVGLKGFYDRLVRKGIRGIIAYVAPSNLAATGRRLAYYISLASSTTISRLWDWRHGVETCRGVATNELSGSDEALEFAVFYAPCAPSALRFMLGCIRVPHSRFEFVDYGSGKGKVLLIASEYPFKKITGVEFDRALHERAVQNLKDYKWRSCRPRKCPVIEPVHLDAKKYRLPADPCFLIFYSPFCSDLLCEVLEGIRLDLEANPRDAVICFFDDAVENSQVPKVNGILSLWEGWEVVQIPDIPKRMDMFYPAEAVVYRFVV
ncbi:MULTISPECIES: class I SAM-dependent methyltransferase [unclassified Lentimonas]|uniref:class I SAM-dependent methyltransferase n=1 Tax=unclassified Lentimonas TaxID=2630993 RepID=UPI001322415C|nr:MULTISPECIES: class I SAM-dependent methyltransferase [unclassified Lentimonas]CAA6693524.1 Unannotated [Lentimonas sp. CC19]CAA6695850.1 Unannotated [Lentimonas sp. CC10]CAA7069770.1 Unannotated [Lentimonas sp. CC11]